MARKRPYKKRGSNGKTTSVETDKNDKCSNHESMQECQIDISKKPRLLENSCPDIESKRRLEKRRDVVKFLIYLYYFVRSLRLLRKIDKCTKLNYRNLIHFRMEKEHKRRVKWKVLRSSMWTPKTY